MIEKFKVLFLEEAADFINNLDEKAREKIIFNIRKAQVINDPVLFKKLTEDIWEFKTLFNKIQYRLFAFWDKVDGKDTVVITTHGIIKKTGKTPQKELQKAVKIKNLYFEQKKSK